jgi:hypothetical protein
MPMHLSPSAIITAIVLFVGALAWGIRKVVPLEYLRHHHEVAFPIFLQIGVIYAVLLAFLFSLEWDTYKSARAEVEQEAITLITLMRLAQNYPTPLRTKIEHQIVDYTQAIINYDWPKMAKKNEDTRAGENLGSLWQTYMNISPTTAKENILFQTSLTHLQKLTEFRQKRMFISTEKGQTRVWMILIGMGGVIVSISFMFGMRYIWAQTCLIATLAGMITTIIVLILIMSTPFSGRFQVPSSALQEILVKMQPMVEKTAATF